MLELNRFGRVKARAGVLGIEVEVEGLEVLPNMDTINWKSKPEDSLRNYGMEYITAKPMPLGERKTEAVKDLCKMLNSKKTVKDCPRTSVHVHYNVSKHTPSQIVSCCVAFWLVENLLANYCGEDRESNLFCLRLKDAEGLIDLFQASLDSFPPFKSLSDNVRYAGLNTKAINDFGSIETRLHGGTIDERDINTWTDELAKLFQNAVLLGTPEDVFDHYLKVGPEKFVKSMFSTVFAEKLLKGGTSLVEENAPLLVDLAYCKNWKEWEASLFKKVLETEARMARLIKKKSGNHYMLFDGTTHVGYEYSNGATEFHASGYTNTTQEPPMPFTGDYDDDI